MIEKLKQIAAAEGGEIKDESQALADIGLDSFGYAIFWLEAASAFEVEYKHEWVMSLDYAKFTIEELMKKTIELQNVAN